ncbi:hypothetical protein TNCV_2847021 [Trichonephila clavipes]|nr:hypothetical protein TNCV_2847021 [Trichonephila clavipes]
MTQPKLSQIAMLLSSGVYSWDTYERREIGEHIHTAQPQKNTDFITNDDPSIEPEEVHCFSFRDGNPFQAKETDFFPEEDTTKSYSGFEPEPSVTSRVS